MFRLWEWCASLKKHSQGIEVCLQGGGELKLHLQLISLALDLGLLLFGETGLNVKLGGNLCNDPFALWHFASS